jgi:hypothetical protein
LSETRTRGMAQPPAPASRRYSSAARVPSPTFAG